MPTVYEGSTRRLVVAFDVGTTYSGISYCILKPGDVPKVCSVTQFPGQEHVSGTTKIPSVLMYDRQGVLRAAGAETLLDENVYKAETEGWTKAEWFKLRLRPQSMPAKLKTSTLPPLPPSKSVVSLFADLLAYLMRCAERFILNTHPTLSAPLGRRSSRGDLRSSESGPTLWSSLRQKAEFVIGHPNGWEGPQQAKMRQAAVMAGLVPNTTEGMTRLRFVSEGEASLCYCLGEGVGVSRWTNNTNHGFIIADLGGGTLDFSAYRVTKTKPLQVEEIAANRCEPEGSTFVTLRAKGHLKHKLTAYSSPYASDEHVALIASRFDETVKRTFRNSEDVCLVPFGSLFDKDPENGIVNGKMKLSGLEVAAFFEPAVTAAVRITKALIEESKVDIAAVYLVGGFSASPYVLSQLRERLGRIRVNIPDSQTAKAVAEGAVRFYLHNYVVSRVAKLTYGVVGNRTFRAENPEHVKRRAWCYMSSRGVLEVPGAFHTVLEKGTVVSRKTEFEKELFRDINSLEELSAMKFRIWAYRGSGPTPEWVDDRSLVRKLCSVVIDLSSLRDSLRARVAANGNTYWRVPYTVVLSFGGTELKAQCKWVVDGYERRSPATILYDEAAEIVDDAEGDDEGGLPNEDATAHISGRMELIDLS